MKFIYTLLFSAFFGMSIAQTTDLRVEYLRYENNEVIPEDSIHTNFRIINDGLTTIPAGDTLYMSSFFNGSEFDLQLFGPPTKQVLEEDLESGDTLVINSGYLLASLTAPFVGGFPLEVKIRVWGIGSESYNDGAGESPSDVQVTFIEVEENLAIDFINYENGDYLTTTELSTSFEITNKGAQNLAVGDTIVVSAVINDALYSLDLFPETPSYIVLVEELAIGETLTIDAGELDASETLLFLGGDSLEFSLKAWGVGAASYQASKWALYDTDTSDNISTIIYEAGRVTSVESINEEVASVYPNPTVDFVNFDFGTVEVRQLIVTNVEGVEVLVEAINQTTARVDVSSLPSGLYMYRADDLFTGKLLIK